jgi:hypothetical protein
MGKDKIRTNIDDISRVMIESDNKFDLDSSLIQSILKHNKKIQTTPAISYLAHL